MHDERAFGYVAAKSLILLVDGLPCLQTTAYGFLKMSIPTAMQSCCEESPRFLACPYPCVRSVSTMYVSSIQMRLLRTILS